MTAVRIRRLTLSNFRSYHAAQIDVGASLVVLTGPNATHGVKERGADLRGEWERQVEKAAVAA